MPPSRRCIDVVEQSVVNVVDRGRTRRRTHTTNSSTSRRSSVMMTLVFCLLLITAVVRVDAIQWL